MQLLKLSFQFFIIYFCLLALIPISVIILTWLIGYKKIKKENPFIQVSKEMNNTLDDGLDDAIDWDIKP